jgi:alpha-L-arabinofuranosidase
MRSRARYHNLLHRNADIVDISNRSNLTNSFCSGIIQTDKCELYKTPTYYAQQLYATLAGNRTLAIEPAAAMNETLDVSATVSSARDAVTLFVVNDSVQDIGREIDLSAFHGQEHTATIWTLTDKQKAGEPDVANSFEEPERVAPSKSKVETKSTLLFYQFPALSLTVIRWPITSEKNNPNRAP